MKLACIGGGPAGLYFAIAMKRLDPQHQITVFERNQPDDTFGWGVVFSDQTMANMRNVDPASADLIDDSLAHWDDIEVRFGGQEIRSGGHGFCGIARKRLLNILQQRAIELGVDLRFETEVDPAALPEGYDLIIASDGVNSRIRSATPEKFGPHITPRLNKYIWLGTTTAFPAFTFAFEQLPEGWIWAHAYQFDKTTSTFIVECSEETWRALGFDQMSNQEGIARCEQIFAKHLDGTGLKSNANHLRGSAWLNFQHITCDRWYDGNVILMGDAAHTAHFSVGSGTKLAIEDAISLADQLARGADLPTTLQAYQAERSLEVLKLQNAARNSTEWFEHLPRYLSFEPMQFAYSLLTRSQRVSHDNLRVRDPAWLRQLESWFQNRSSDVAVTGHPLPPMFTPFRLRGMTLANRVVVSPMSMYSAVDGTPGDFHLVHYGARAQGGAGLVITEMTDVSPDGRITPGCAGIYTDEQQAAWRRIVEFVHADTGAKIGLQLGHAGPKGSVHVPWVERGEDQPLPAAEGWDLLAPSAVPWSDHHATPRAIDRAQMDRVRDDYVAATRRALACGFDLVELHMAHGYLLSAFLTPVSNKRTDEYGGSIENRLRFPLEVFHAVRAAWPEERPISVRLSATDWAGDAGLSEADLVAIGTAFRTAGADILDVSAGQTTVAARPVYGRMFQTPFSDLLRNEAGTATMAVGNIFEADHLNSILAAGRADLCCLGRPHLSDPYWTLREAAKAGVSLPAWPAPYQSGGDQLRRNLARANAPSNG